MTTITDFSIDDVKTTQNGAKVANIKAGDGNALEYLAEEFLSVPIRAFNIHRIYFVEKRSSHQYH